MTQRFRALALLAGLLLVGVPRARGAPAELPVVYGGNAPGEAPEKDARRVTGASGPARWFLEPLPPIVPEVYSLGPARFTACAGERVSIEAVSAGVAEAQDMLDQVLPDEASVAFERAALQLPCLEGPLAPDLLAQFQFLRGIAALTRADRDKDLGLAAFAAAIAADPDTQWDEDYPAFPRSVFFEGKVALLNTPRAHLWILPSSDTQVWIEGTELAPSLAGADLLAGPHIVHIRRGDDTWSGVLELEPGAEVVLGSAEAAWDALLSTGDPERAARAYAVRRTVAVAFGERVVLTRPGAFSALDADGTLHTWSDEGAFRPRLGMDIGGSWLFYERTIESPPVDIPNPSDHWGLPEVAFVVRFHPVLSAHVGGGVAWSGPFAVGEQDHWRLMASARLGVGAELPTGILRPGAYVDLGLLLPGELRVAGVSTNVVLFGPVAGATLAARLIDGLWLQLHAGGGWLGSETASAGLNVQLRLPPFRRSAARVVSAMTAR